MNNLKINSWKPYKMDDIFSFTKGKRLTKNDMVPGKLNYLGAISENNAVREFIDAPAQHLGNCITVNYNGSVGEAFYQSKPFWATDDINILELKDYELNENIGLFLCTVIKKNKFKFSYGRKWTLEKMKETFILLPSKNGRPDYEYMDKYIRELNINHIKTKTKAMVPSVNTFNWDWIKLSDFFEINRSENINCNDLNDFGDIPYITRTKLNNGVEKKVDASEYTLNQGNVIIIGGESAKAFYQSKAFVTGNNITILKSNKLNKYNALFITTILNKETFKYSYGRAFNTKNIRNTLIKLPIKNGEPDWDYMECYIKSIPYSDKI